MLIRIARAGEVKTSEITPEATWLRRREFLRRSAVGLGATAGSLLLPGCGQASTDEAETAQIGSDDPFRTREPQTSFEDATTYNNFYEFGTDKKDPARNAHSLITKPWNVEISGECARPGSYAIEDLLRPDKVQERVYRLRCVEAWSMVIPWRGVPLADVLERVEPTSRAKFVEFRTLLDPKQMPGQRRRVLKWPYREGLRIDEAMHPLTLLATGMYGRDMPNQNGAPIRLVVPWKYGFKSIKSIVSIRLVEQQPDTSWNLSTPSEYGFYSNVNPEVDHPRWSQKRERRIGEWAKRKTLMFNGYAEEVAPLYAGLDLRKHF
jgi:sulfoxide reductase catalytic subunit YedY